MHNTILVTILKELNVKFTLSYANKVYHEHPYRDTMFGLSEILSEYKIPNGGIKIDNKDITNLDTPFIAHLGNKFVVVENVTENSINYNWDGKKIESNFAEFSQLWSGVVLLAEPDEYSIEPEYDKHIKENLLYSLQKSTTYLLIIGVLVFASFSNRIWHSWGLTINIILNVIGVYISCLLVAKQMKINSRYADKICSLFHQKDCNSLLESSAAKIGNLFSWSEIGLGYFTSNILLILFFPTYINYYALINILCLPYSLWSVWYQYKVAKQWCNLCLIVQVVIWAIFIINIISGSFGNLMITPFALFSLLTIYALPFLLLNIIISKFSKANQAEILKQELISLKLNPEIFISLLKKQKYYEVNQSVSTIIFGNPNASLRVTILTNPHCEPCAILHKKVEDILKKQRNNLSIQYVFAAFKEELLVSNQFLIATYKNENADRIKSIYSEWFTHKKYFMNSYFKEFDWDINSIDIQKELENHERWRQQNQLMATPTILVNGYLLPENYKIEDIIYFSDLKLN